MKASSEFAQHNIVSAAYGLLTSKAFIPRYGAHESNEAATAHPSAEALGHSGSSGHYGLLSCILYEVREL